MTIPVEIERKYLVSDYELPTCLYTTYQVIQYYLLGNRRLRWLAGSDGTYHFFLTTKQQINAVKRFELEQEVGFAEVMRLLLDVDPECRPVAKRRVSFAWGKDQHCDLDDYRPWTDLIVFEAELKHEDQPVAIPPFIKVIREVTEDPDYSNYSLSKRVI